MFSGKVVAGTIMIESFHPAFEINQLIITSLVFNMAKLAVSVIRIAVKAGSRKALCFDRRVTGKAVFRKRCPVSVMTFLAVIHTFKKLV